MRRIRCGITWVAAVLLIASIPVAGGQGSVEAALTLQDAVALALKNNPAVKASAAYSKSVARGIAAARATRFPRLDFSEGFTRGNNPVYVFGTLLTQRRFGASDFALNLLNTPLPLNNFQTQFAGSLALYDAGQTGHRLRDARLKVEAARQSERRTTQEIVFETVQAYLSILRTRDRVRVAEDAVKQSEADLRRAQARQKQGFAVSSDVLSAQAQLAQKNQDLIEAQNAAAIAKVTLDEVVGLPEGAAYRVEGSFPKGEYKLASPDQLEAKALELRPDYRQAQIRRERALNGVSTARNSFLPTVTTFAQWDRDSVTLGGNSGRNWTAGVALNFNIFNGGADRARLSSAFYREEQARALLAQMALQVRLQVREAYLDVQAAQKRIAASEQGAVQAQASLRIVQNRYEAGLATINDVLQDETAYTAAEQNHLNAIYDYELTVAALELATGQLGPDSPAITLWKNGGP